MTYSHIKALLRYLQIKRQNASPDSFSITKLPTAPAVWPTHVQCVTAQRQEGVNTTSEETFPSGDDGRGLYSWRLLVLTVLFATTTVLKTPAFTNGKNGTFSLSANRKPYLHRCAVAHNRLNSSNSSSKSICKKEDPEMAEIRHVTSCVTFSLWSLTQLLTKRTSYAHDTKVTSYTQLTDF